MKIPAAAPGPRLLLAITAVMSLLCGCGGGSASSSGRTGRAVIRVIWPAPSRLIPSAANSIRVTLRAGGSILSTHLIARPAATTAFLELAPGSYALDAAAFPSTDGSGISQAGGAAPMAIVADQVTTVTLTMDSTITLLKVTPPTSTIVVGGLQQLTATAFDAAGDVVITNPAKIVWKSSDPGNAAVDEVGQVTAMHGTIADITATETESGKSGAATVTVNNGNADVTVQ